MANNLEFKISAEDQATRVVETVQLKIQNFGRDVAKMAFGFAGPLALVQMGFQKISEAYDEMQKKRQEAIDFGVNGMYEELKIREQITQQLEKGYSILLAQQKLNQEAVDLAEKQTIAREEATRVFLETNQKGKEIQSQNMVFDAESGTTFRTPIGVLARRPEIQAEALKSTEALITALDEEKEKLKQQAQNWDFLSDSIKKYNEELSKNERLRKNQINQKRLQDEIKSLEFQRDNLKSNSLTVSSLREIGGGLSGESSGIAAQAKDNQTALDAQKEAINEQIKVTRDYNDTIKNINKTFEGLDDTIGNLFNNFTNIPSTNNAFINPGIDTTK